MPRMPRNDHDAKPLRDPDCVPMFGMRVAKLTESGTAEKILAWAREGRARREAGGRAGPAKFVATLNVDFVVNAVPGRPFGGNRELWELLKGADLVVADGMPIVALSRLMRDPLPERVAGSDLVPMLCPRCAEEGLSVYVLGGTDEALDEAFAVMEKDAGRPLEVAGRDTSKISLDDDPAETVARINAAKPDLLFVALGNPKEEIWMGRNAAALDVPAMIGVGGSFNFVSGRVKRAPRWVQKCGLEWVHRVCQEPGRLWRRYAFGLVKYPWVSLLQLLGRYGR